MERSPGGDVSKLCGEDGKKRGPLGFIVDLFRPKKAKELSPEISLENEETLDFSTEETAEDGLELGKQKLGSKVDEGKGEGQSEKGENPDQLQQDILLSTPKKQKQKTADVIDNIEKLQVSREDNPASGRYKNEHHLGEIRKGSQGHVIPLGAPKTVLPPTGGSLSQQNHNHLIRSPPPSLKLGQGKRGDSQSTALEAETIIAIQRGGPGLDSVTKKVRSLLITAEIKTICTFFSDIFDQKIIGKYFEEGILIRTDSPRLL